VAAQVFIQRSRAAEAASRPVGVVAYRDMGSGVHTLGRSEDEGEETEGAEADTAAAAAAKPPLTPPQELAAAPDKSLEDGSPP